MQSQVVKKNGKLLLNINGEIFVPNAYMSYVKEQADYVGFKKNGNRLFFGCIQMGDTFFAYEEGIWKAENVYDFSSVKNVLDTIIGTSKKGEIYVLLRINLNVPKWWLEKYPDEVMETSTGKKWLQSPCSKQWKKDCAEFLKRLQSFILTTVFPISRDCR